MDHEQFLKMSLKERLDIFLLDTFQPHTRHDRTMTYAEVRECYEQWCEAMNIPPMGGPVHLGSALKKRFFCIKPDNRAKWFIELRPDVVEQAEELDKEFTPR